MKKALLFGVNDFFGSVNDLNGCVNDVNLFAKRLYDDFGYVSKILKDSQATVNNVKEELLNFLSTAKADDFLAIWHSHHGTQVPDYNHDEKDRRDEALYVHNGIITDDDYYKIILTKPGGIPLFIGMDCCFSGDNTKGIESKARYMPFLNGRMMDEKGNLKGSRRKKRMLVSNDMDYVVLTGCREDQTSSDALIGGKYHGAMTYYAMRELVPGITYEEWFRRIRKRLPNAFFEQEPQLEGNPEMMKQGVFGSEIKKKCWFKFK